MECNNHVIGAYNNGHCGIKLVQRGSPYEEQITLRFKCCPECGEGLGRDDAKFLTRIADLIEQPHNQHLGGPSPETASRLRQIADRLGGTP